MDPLYVPCRPRAELLPPASAQVGASAHAPGEEVPALTPIPDVLLIRFAGRVSAVAAPGGIQLLPHIDALEEDHPSRRWVFCLCLFALDVIEERLHGSYSDTRAALFARQVLMPDDEFRSLAGYDDATLAECFNVPLEQIAEKRIDLLVRLGLPAD